ncbi:MAG: HAMP domain-containing histidine kinase [Myxococcales bacterium]|nr:HAMP domain-containing histidine kinase [Myxococcales bacterium]
MDRGRTVGLVIGVAAAAVSGALLVLALGRSGLAARLSITQLALLAAGLVALLAPLYFVVQRALVGRWSGARAARDKALSHARVGLAGADDEVDVIAALGDVLAALGASPAYLVRVGEENEERVLRCSVLVGAARAAPLPERIGPAEFGPVAEVLERGATLRARDGDASVASSASGVRPPFWAHYGVERVIPCAAAQRVEALLVCGASVAFGPADEEQFEELARQVGAALSRIRRVSELRAAHDELGAQVMEQTGALDQTLANLSRTEDELVEAQSQAVVTKLVAGVVHELNTPLGTLRSSLDTLRRANERCRDLVAGLTAGNSDERSPPAAAARALKLTDVQRSSIEVIEESCDRVSRFVDRLERLVALDAADVAPIDVCQSLSDALTLARSSVGAEREVTLRVPDEAPRVEGPPAKLNWVFVTLIENALKAVDSRGSVTISVERDGGWTTVRIEDTGKGIAQLKVDKLFDFAFTAKMGGRIGLRVGLPASKRIVRSLGGDLRISSQLGVGTTVEVKLPAPS